MPRHVGNAPKSFWRPFKYLKGAGDSFGNAQKILTFSAMLIEYRDTLWEMPK
jgi:hypothetical protein